MKYIKQRKKKKKNYRFVIPIPEKFVKFAIHEGKESPLKKKYHSSYRSRR